jgi:hypothetical protein
MFENNEMESSLGGTLHIKWSTHLTQNYVRTFHRVLLPPFFLLSSASLKMN